MLYQTDNPHGGDLYSRPIRLDFSANTNPLGTPAGVRQAVADALAHLDWYPDPYCRDLVRAIAGFEQVAEEYVLCGCGAAELIFSFCLAVQPKRALELAPTFSEYTAALESVGCVVDRYLLRAENAFVLDDCFLTYLEKGKWDTLFLCNPNNPTGQMIRPALLEAIASICHEKGVRLFLDECFLDLSDGEGCQSLKRLLAKYSGLCILKAFTKSYGMAGLRLGYCLTSDRELLSAMSRTVQPWNVSGPAQAAGVAALKEQVFLQRTRKIIAEERAWLTEKLRALGFCANPSQANYLLFYSPLPLGKLLLKQGIQIRDCSNYHGLEKGWYRIAVKTHAENHQLITALQEIRSAHAK